VGENRERIGENLGKSGKAGENGFGRRLRYRSNDFKDLLDSVVFESSALRIFLFSCPAASREIEPKLRRLRWSVLQFAGPAAPSPRAKRGSQTASPQSDSSKTQNALIVARLFRMQLSNSGYVRERQRRTYHEHRRFVNLTDLSVSVADDLSGLGSARSVR
jgi:hypothetical protein